MADEEQFSLCWNNFNSNLSAGFHESLCRGDLVDVTLAAEGHLVKAHRLVLSVCSPYFRKMFTQMPANQHAFVFLKDVSHAALKDLIQFMYCGEVNVKQDALPTFISTAEALQIKGLTETGDAATTPASAQSPAKVPTPAPSTTSTTATTTSPRTRGIQRNVSRTSYKIDSEDSSDDRPIIPAATTTTQQKRLIQRSLTPVSSVPAIKRIKTTADPLEESDDHQQSQQLQHQTQQLVDPEGKDETEFIDLPIESLPTKAEPDYGEEDAGEVEAVEQDVNYVEDDSYGDMKYDESYFTENEDAKAGASGFADQSYAESGGGDQSANEAQDTTHHNLKKSGRQFIKRHTFIAATASNTTSDDDGNNVGKKIDNEINAVDNYVIKSYSPTRPHHSTTPTAATIISTSTVVVTTATPTGTTSTGGITQSKTMPPNAKPENIVKIAENGHALVILKRTRVKGFCVECIKKKSDPHYKKTMNKITTYCPKCPGGNWICESCFDETHHFIIP